jgi:protease-4
MSSEGWGRRLRRYFGRFLMGIGAVALLFFLLIGLVSVFVIKGEGLPGQVILELDLEGGLIENVPSDPIGALLNRDALTLRDAVEALKRGETDSRVTGLIARIGGSTLGLAQIEELRAAVTSFRAAGKPAVMFSETFGEMGQGQGSYYLATAFDEIALQPSGDVGLAGLIMETPFFAGTLDKLGVEPRMDQRYEYKNALNSLTETEMTDAHREATGRVLASVFENLVAGVAASQSVGGVVQLFVGERLIALNQSRGRGCSADLVFK